MNNTKLILTGNKNYSAMEVIDLFSGYVSPSNVEILIDHLTYEELSECISGFIEEGDAIHFKLEDNYIKCSKK